MHKTRKRRLLWLGALLSLTLVAALAVHYYPRGLRGPETVASEYLDALVRAPGDFAALRAAGHLDENDDPHAPTDGIPTRIALEYLHARMRQGRTFDIDVVGHSQPAAQRYATVLEISERGERDTAPRRFAVSLRQRDDGDWRVHAIGVLE